MSDRPGMTLAYYLHVGGVGVGTYMSVERIYAHLGGAHMPPPPHRHVAYALHPHVGNPGDGS